MTRANDGKVIGKVSLHFRASGFRGSGSWVLARVSDGVTFGVPGWPFYDRRLSYREALTIADHVNRDEHPLWTGTGVLTSDEVKHAARTICGAAETFRNLTDVQREYIASHLKEAHLD